MLSGLEGKAEVSTPTDLPELSEDEQWRLVNESGILSRVPAEEEDDSEEDTPLGEEIFGAITLIIPFSFLLLLMDILIHQQYGKQPSLQELVDRMLPAVPILSIFIFYTTRYKQNRRMQFFLFLLANVIGPRMIYLVNRGSWLVNIKQCPPLATVWIYAIVQLDLGPAVLNLIVVGIWVWWNGMKLFF